MDGTTLSDEVVAAVRSEIEAAGSPAVCLATVLVGDDRPSQTYVRMKHRRAETAGMQSLNVDVARHGDACAGRGSRRRARRRPGSARHPRPASVATGSRRGCGDPARAGREGCRWPHGPFVGSTAPRSTKSRPLHAARRHAAARAVRRTDRRSASCRHRPLDPGRTAAGVAVRTQGCRRDRHDRAFAARLISSTCVARPTSSSRAAGQPRMVTADHVRPGAAVIDVGVSRTENGIVGDVDFESVRDRGGMDHADARWHRADDRRLSALEHAGRSAATGELSRPDRPPLLGNRTVIVVLRFDDKLRSSVLPHPPSEMRSDARATAAGASAVRVDLGLPDRAVHRLVRG